MKYTWKFVWEYGEDIPEWKLLCDGKYTNQSVLLIVTENGATYEASTATKKLGSFEKLQDAKNAIIREEMGGIRF
jgi:hypothetical protein